MKHLIFLALLLAVACHPESQETPPAYPATYVFDQMELNPSRYYVLGTGNAYTQIAAKGSFANFDQLFSEEVHDARNVVFYIDSIRLIDATTATLYLNPDYSPQTASVPVSYTQNGNTFQFSIAGATESLRFQLDSPSQKFRWGLVGTAYTYLDSLTQQTNYSPISLRDNGFETHVRIDSLLGVLRTKPGVRSGDTVVVNFPVGLYKAR